MLFTLIFVSSQVLTVLMAKTVFGILWYNDVVLLSNLMVMLCAHVHVCTCPKQHAYVADALGIGAVDTMHLAV